jgi:hypothetical protein
MNDKLKNVSESGSVGDEYRITNCIPIAAQFGINAIGYRSIAQATIEPAHRTAPADHFGLQQR